MKQSKATINAFRKTKDLLCFVENNTADIAFLDIEMNEFTVLELAAKLNQS